MANALDRCRFRATSSGTVDFVVSAAIAGYQTPASAGAVNSTVYRYVAESDDLTQWEIGYGAYTTSGTTLARTTVLFNSSGTTSKISFTNAPQVAIVLLAEDYVTGQIPGTATNDSANAGNVGEYVSSTLAFGSAISLTTDTVANITSISLTAGDWEVAGSVLYNLGTTTFTYFQSSCSTTSATIDFTPGRVARISVAAQSGVGGSPAEVINLIPSRFSINSTTTVYLVAMSSFSAGTVTAYGIIKARRVR